MVCKKKKNKKKYVLLKTKNSDYNTLYKETPLLHPSSYTLT